MFFRRYLFLWLKKLIYGFFILWVCGLTPLVYFEGFSSHFGAQHTYYANILGQSRRAQKLALVRSKILAQNKKVRLPRQLSAQTDAISPNRTVATQFFVSSFNQSYLLVATDSTIKNDFSLCGGAIPTVLMGRSAWLPLPEKPPPFSCD